MGSPNRSEAPSTARPTPGKQPDHDALRAFFSGKRKTDRRVARFRVELHGNGKRVVGRTMDLSEGGVLVRVPDDEAQRSEPLPAMLATLKLLEEHFQTGVVIGFPTVGIRVPVTPIRLAQQPDDGTGFLLGFKFDRPLDAAEVSKLLPSPPPRGPLSSLPKSGATLHALVFVESELVMGPVLAGHVAALEGGMLDVRADTTAAAPTADATSALLRDRAARLRVTESGKTLWEGPIRVVSTQDAADGLGGVDVRVETEAPVSPGLARRFRQRS